jgi:hypothetical protein
LEKFLTDKAEFGMKVTETACCGLGKLRKIFGWKKEGKPAIFINDDIGSQFSMLSFL